MPQTEPLKVRRISKEEYPLLLRQLEQLPKFLDLAGELPSDDDKFLCVIGSRSHSSYGDEVCKKLITGLAGYPIVIVSGLAIGIDSIAHEAALQTRLKTIAFPGSGLSETTLYPATHRALAKKIVRSGGALLSPFEHDQIGAPWTFPVRNQLMAGVSHATLIIEARKDSGTLITAKAVAECSRDLLAVPGPIFSDLSQSPNKLIRDGAIAITSSLDILEALNLHAHSDSTQQHLFNIDSLNLLPDERKIIECLRGETLTSTVLIEKTSLQPATLNITLSELELRGLVVSSGGRYRLA